MSCVCVHLVWKDVSLFVETVLAAHDKRQKKPYGQWSVTQLYWSPLFDLWGQNAPSIDQEAKIYIAFFKKDCTTGIKVVRMVPEGSAVCTACATLLSWSL